MGNIIFNVVICLKELDTKNISIVIERIWEYIKPQQIHIITNAKNKIACAFENLSQKHKQPTFIFDENKIYKGLNFEFIRQTIESRGVNPWRTGWYLQQFLKMGYAKLSIYKPDKTIAFSLSEIQTGGGGDNQPIFTKYYLIWDADCIALTDMDFFYFTQSIDCCPKIYFTKAKEYHAPYFKTLEKLQIPIHIKTHRYPKILMRVATWSFIAEHMMINNMIMCDLIDRIENKHKKSFFEAILDCIDNEDLVGSGFSEYETYGNFIVSEYNSQTIHIHRKMDRTAKYIIGINPSQKQLEWYSDYYDMCSIETWIPERFVANLTKYKIFRLVSPYIWHKILIIYDSRSTLRKHIKTKIKEFIKKLFHF